MFAGPAQLTLPELSGMMAPSLKVLDVCDRFDLCVEHLRHITALSALTTLKLQLAKAEGPQHQINDHSSLLHDIACLPQLHTLGLYQLAAPTGAVTVLSKLDTLRDLHIVTGTSITYDLQDCTQLTSLRFSSWFEHSDDGILLPKNTEDRDSTVSLVKLTLDVPCFLQNLGSATNLQIINIAPLALCQGQTNWPLMLPNLKEVRDADAEYGSPTSRLPPEWVSYTNLTHITLNTYEAVDLPRWFTGMQHLRSLHMNGAHLPAFPLSFSLLDGLTSLHLENFEGYLAQEVVALASLPDLQELYFGYEYLLSKTFDDRELAHIKQLESMFILHEPPLLRLDHEIGLDFNAYRLEDLSEQAKERAALLLSQIREVLAFPQGED